MSLELKLLPFYGGWYNFSHEVLIVPQDYDLFEKIRALPKMEVDDDFRSYLSKDGTYEEPHYGNTIKDPYGDRIKYVLAKDLKKVNITGPTGAYVNALPDKAKIALYWY